MQRLEERGEGVAELGRAGDVGCDGGQDVVARQQHALGRVPQAEMVHRVTRGVHREPLPAGHHDRVALIDTDGRLRHSEAERPAASVRLDEQSDGLVRRRFARRAPRGASHAVQLRLPEFDEGVRIEFQQLQVDIGVGDVPGRAGHEGAVGQQVGAGLLPQLMAGAVVVGMGVGDDRGVHPVEGDARLLQAVEQGRPGLGAGQSGIHQHCPGAVDERIAVDVSQSRHADRQLHAQHSGRHLGHLGRGRLLLLFGVSPDAHRCSVPAPPMKPAARYQRSSSTLSLMSSNARCDLAFSGARPYTSGCQRLASSLTVDTSIDR